MNRCSRNQIYSLAETSKGFNKKKELTTGTRWIKSGTKKFGFGRHLTEQEKYWLRNEIKTYLAYLVKFGWSP